MAEDVGPYMESVLPFRHYFLLNNFGSSYMGLSEQFFFARPEKKCQVDLGFGWCRNFVNTLLKY